MTETGDYNDLTGDLDVFKSTMPPMRSPNWAVEKIHLTEDDVRIGNIRAAIHCTPEQECPPGDYTKLIHETMGVVMSDTPFEVRSNLPIIRRARAFGGDILLNGLGLGWVVENLLRMDQVTSVTVVEKDGELAEMIGLLLESDERYSCVVDDALEYRPPRGRRFSCVWHDIWSTICYDNYEQMKTLTRRYARRCDWQACWSRDLVLRDHRRFG